MDNTEYIDDYFNGSPGEDEKRRFGQRIIDDVSFAEEVAFYLSANGAIKEQVQEDKKQRFREIYDQRKVVPITKRPVKNLVRYMAAASIVAAVVLATTLFNGHNNSPAQMADRYIEKTWQHLPTTMGIGDSIQVALGLFNAGALAESLEKFDAILEKDSANDDAKKFAGIASLRLGKYDEALAHFSSLAAKTNLTSNYGKLGEAVTLLKRNNTGDVEAAKKLLQEIKENDLEGKTEAEEWSKHL